MRIAVSGAQNTGKSTLIKDFLNVWPSFKTTDKTYREVLKEKNLPHSTVTTKETQLTILNWMTNELKKCHKDTKIMTFAFFLKFAYLGFRAKQKSIYDIMS